MLLQEVREVEKRASVGSEKEIRGSM